MKGQKKHGTTSASGWDKLATGSFSNNLAIAPFAQPSMPATNHHVGVFLNTNATELNYVYRGTASVPENKFASGFVARGQNLDLTNHINNWPTDSAYISCSLSKDAAASFATDKSKVGFVYEINPPLQGINVENHLYDDFLEGKLKKTHLNAFLSEHEVSIPHRVLPEDIKGAWKIERYDYHGDFIPNPEYLPSTAVRLANVGRALGHATFAIGAGLDSYNLIKAGKHNGYFKEATRIIASWTAAVTMGAAPAEACFIIGGSVGGPVGALIGGIGCGALGSVIGYHGASQMSVKLFSKASFLKSDGTAGVPVAQTNPASLYRKKY